MRTCIVLLGIWVLYVEPQSAQSIQDQQQPTQQNSSPNPLVSEQQKESDQRSGEKENERKNKKGFITEIFQFVREYNAEIVTLSTAIMAIFTFALFISTHLLWCSGKKHAERELRAYVFPIDFKVRNFKTALRTFSPAQKISAFVTIKNTGQTPAYKFTCQVKMIVRPFPQTDFTISEEEAEFTTGYIGPEGTVSYSPKDTLLPQGHAQAVAEGHWAIYVFGRIDYVDAFNKQWWTTFRTLARGDHRIMSFAKGEEDALLLETAKDGNDADRYTNRRQNA